MTEAAVAPAAEPAAAPSAGAMLRRAREARGLHVAALAASLKVPPKRLEALEQDRWGELPDPAFTRALAQSVCRVLKTDPAPVLALLPRADANQLEHVSGSINTPFRERSGSGEPGMGGLVARPVVWIVGLLLLAAGAVLLWPASLAPDSAANGPDAVVSSETPLPLPLPLPLVADAGTSEAPATPADAAAAGGSVTGSPPAPADSGTGTTPGAAQPAAAPGAAADTPAAAAAQGAPTAVAPATPLLEIRADADSWVEVRDATGQVLVSRTLKAGETLPLDPALPARLTTGNVAGTEVRLRGERVDLSAQQRGNIARLELR